MIGLLIAAGIFHPGYMAETDPHEYVHRIVFRLHVDHQPKDGFGGEHTTRTRHVLIQRRDWLGNWHTEKLKVEQFPEPVRKGPYQLVTLRRWTYDDQWKEVCWVTQRYRTRCVLTIETVSFAAGMEGVR